MHPDWRRLTETNTLVICVKDAVWEFERRWFSSTRLPSLCVHHYMFLCSTNFRHSKRWLATWCPRLKPTTLQTVTVDADCWSCLSTNLQSHYPLVEATVDMHVDSRSKRHLSQGDNDELYTTMTFWTSNDENDISDSYTTRFWVSLVVSSAGTAGQDNCGFIYRVVEQWISPAYP